MAGWKWQARDGDGDDVGVISLIYLSLSECVGGMDDGDEQRGWTGTGPSYVAQGSPPQGSHAPASW
jgi:hypothetical protein